jgi:hypothetical protein
VGFAKNTSSDTKNGEAIVRQATIAATDKKVGEKGGSSCEKERGRSSEEEGGWP